MFRTVFSYDIHRGVPLLRISYMERQNKQHFAYFIYFYDHSSIFVQVYQLWVSKIKQAVETQIFHIEIRNIPSVVDSVHSLTDYHK